MSKKASKNRGKAKKGKSAKASSSFDASAKESTAEKSESSLADSATESESEPESDPESESESESPDNKDTAKSVPDNKPTEAPPNGVVGIEKIDHVVGLAEQAFLMFFLFALIGVGTFQFIAGMIFNINHTWPFEALQYLVFAIAMFGAALSAQKGQMMSMDFLSRKLSDKNRVMLRVVTNLFVMFACYLLTRGGFIGVEATEGSEYELLPKSTAYLVLPVGAMLIALHYVLHTICDVLYLAAGRTPPEEEGLKVH